MEKIVREFMTLFLMRREIPSIVLQFIGNQLF